MDGRIIQKSRLIWPVLIIFKAIPISATTGKMITAEMNQVGSFLRIER